MSSNIYNLFVCAVAAKRKFNADEKLQHFDLISRISDQKSFGTFYGSITLSIGGINETGVSESQFVSYMTSATTAKNMGESATGKAQNVYVVEIDTGRVVRASEGIENTAGNDDSPVEQGERIPILYDGKWVAFTTKATSLGGKVILRNIETGEKIPFIVNSSGGISTPTLSRSGKYIAFPSNEKLDKGFDTSGVFAAYR